MSSALALLCIQRHPEHQEGAAPRSKGDVSAVPIQPRQAPWGLLTVFSNMGRAATLPAGIFLAGAFAAAGLIAIPEAPKAPRHPNMFPDAAVYLPGRILPSRSRILACASVSCTTAAFIPPKRE